jgi:ATP-binding cassette subfamily F protein 3
MLAARDLTLRRGADPLFEKVNFTIYRGERVGLTGANGTGKSSLFAALRGELAPDSGDIELPASLTIGYVEQEVAALDRPAIEFVLDGDTEFRRLTAAIEDAERRDAAMELAELFASLDAMDGYRARARAASIMHGLGFVASQHQSPVAEFSGGWRVRLSMARALNSRADLLLLDEPTNHLDLDAIVWLEEWLGAAAGTVLIVSHDREFLDAVIGRVLHIENRGIKAYSGNYTAFEQKRSEDLALQQTLKTRQARRIAEITSFVNRFRAQATKARQAQSRLKMLERMERIVPAHVDSPFEFAFAPPQKMPRPLLTVEAAACGYDERMVIGGINACIGPQDRIALLGPNGAGKSTLTRMLAGETEPLTGRRTPAADLAIGYFAQQQVEQLNLGADAFWHMREMGGPDYASGDEQRVRDHLGQFGFQGDRAFEPVARFSGGEKARLTLALLVARRPNLLLLDEPTNHLDIEMRHALTVALQGFHGGLIVVSHDRHLIKTVADTLWLAADGKLSVFDGDLDDYQAWLRARAKTQSGLPTGLPNDSSSRGQPKAFRAGSAAPRRSPKADPVAQWRRELAQIEKKLAALGAERAAIEEQLGKADALQPGELDKLLENYARVRRDADEWEARWIEIGTSLEQAETPRAAP